MVNKKNSSQQGLMLDDVVEEALCFGWIDSKLNVVDNERYKLLLTPRKPQSIWSKNNKQRVEKLVLQGAMTAAGLEKVEAAKADGSWNRLDSIEELKLPEDLKAAFNLNRTAEANFDLFSDSLKKQILWWIESAKRPETRRQRIEKTVAVAEQNRKENLFSS